MNEISKDDWNNKLVPNLKAIGVKSLEMMDMGVSFGKFTIFVDHTRDDKVKQVLKDLGFTDVKECSTHSRQCWIKKIVAIVPESIK